MNRPRPKPGAQCLFYGLIVVLFALAIYMKPPSKTVFEETQTIEQEVLVESDVPDFAAIIDIELKKSTFFSFLLPHIDDKNAEILALRERIYFIQNKLQAGAGIYSSEHRFLSELADQYRINQDASNTSELIRQLLIKVDILPSALVLSQSANESAWGTSRFAREGKNFFGQWCYVQGCGIIPARRGADQQYEVKRFASVEESVHAYFMNINSFPSYASLRATRQQLRVEGKVIDGISLSEGLGDYSARGEAYIYELQSMMHSNDLLQRDDCLAC